MHVIACTGHTWMQIDEEWDLPRLRALNRYHAKFPPLQAIIPRYLGYKAPAEETEPLSIEEHAARLIEQITGGL